MDSKILTQKELKRLFEYNPKTGDFTRVQTVAQQLKGTIAGCKNALGYKRIRIHGKYYYCHRLAYLYMYGHMPTGVVDHVDGNPSNNSIDNLRCVNKSQNSQNIKKSHIDSTSGFLGVWLHKQTGKYVAQITKQGKRLSLGLHETPEQAHNAYVIAKRVMHECGTI